MRGAVNESGNRYGRLTVIARVPRPETDGYSTQAYWLCNCDCGRTATVPGARLRLGKIVSCGCRRIEHRKRLYKRLPHGEAARRRAIDMMKAGARYRNLEWTLTGEDVGRLMVMNCHYCEVQPSNVSRHPKGNGTFTYSGLDRVDNTRGYTIDNVVPCCLTCNHAKSKQTVEQFKTWALRVAARFSGKPEPQDR